MSQIRSVPAAAPTEGGVQVQSAAQAQQAQQTQQAGQAQAPQTVDGMDHEPTAPPATGGDVAAPVEPPDPPSVHLSPIAMQSARSFAAQLQALDRCGDSSESLMLAFLKLQVIDGSQSSAYESVLNAGKLMLRNSCHGAESAMSIIATNQVRAGTDGMGAALRNAGELLAQRNQLVAMLAGLRPDQVARAEAAVEVDKARNEVAQLVLELVDRNDFARGARGVGLRS